MTSEILESLKHIRKHASIKKSFSSYSLSIAEYLITNPTLINKVCNEYNITSQELLFLLTKENVRNLPFLDEIMLYISKIVDKTNQKESNNKKLK